MSLQPRVLVVDDDPVIRDVVRLSCESEGYAVDEASNGSEALTRAHAFHPDLILLDLILPDISGYSVCRDLRADGFTEPIIILSAKDEEIGADDYVIKPFRPREFLARLAVHLRKERPGPPPDSEHIVAGELAIDTVARRVTRGGKEVVLTDTEFDVLAYLAGQPGRALTRDQILDAVWASDRPAYQRAIDVHIRNLRKKIEPDEDRPQYILPVRGVGYRFVPSQ